MCPTCRARGVAASPCCCESAPNNSATRAHGLRGHGCRNIAIYDFVPGISNSPTADDQQQIFAVLSAPLELPYVYNEGRIEPASLMDPGHSDDLVVKLRRLVI
jgi:hypothetical protein